MNEIRILHESAASSCRWCCKASLADNTDSYIRITIGRIDRIVAGFNFATLAGLNRERVRMFLRSMRKEKDLSHRTHNHYIQAIDSFCNWCVTTERLLRNPLRGLEKLNAETDVRHQFTRNPPRNGSDRLAIAPLPGACQVLATMLSKLAHQWQTSIAMSVVIFLTAMALWPPNGHHAGCGRNDASYWW